MALSPTLEICVANAKNALQTLGATELKECLLDNQSHLTHEFNRNLSHESEISDLEKSLSDSQKDRFYWILDGIFLHHCNMLLPDLQQ